MSSARLTIFCESKTGLSNQNTKAFILTIYYKANHLGLKTVLTKILDGIGEGLQTPLKV